jgi:hypothetical protein
MRISLIAVRVKPVVSPQSSENVHHWDRPVFNRDVRGDVPLFLFLMNSLTMQMVVGQDNSIVRFSAIYWALVLPALILPLFALREIIGVLLGRGIFLSAFFVCAGVYHLLRGDYQTIIQLFLLVWVMAWCACDNTDLAASDVVQLFVATILMGAGVALVTDLNPWGFFPNQTSSDYGAWRTSFFPHVANSATMSVIVLMFLTRDVGTARKYLIILLLCAYFLLFGFVRTMFVAAAMYMLLHAVFAAKRIRSPSALFVGVVLLIVTSLAVEVLIVPALDVMQHSSLFSRLLLRGETDLTRSEIYQQLYRPWLWREHLSIFFSSPHFMGLGTFKLLDHVSGNLLPGLGASGSESLPTRLLATYGISTFFFFAFLISQLIRLARSKNAWVVSTFARGLFDVLHIPLRFLRVNEKAGGHYAAGSAAAGPASGSAAS